MEKEIKLLYELRHEKALSLKTRSQYINQLYKPYMQRVENLEIEKYQEDKPRYPANKRDGHCISRIYDKNGFYALHQPTDNKHIMIFAEIEEKREQLSLISKYQQDFQEVGLNANQLRDIRNKIDELFKEVLDIKDKQVNDERELPFYTKVGALFAQGHIYRKKNTTTGYDFYYKEIKFETKIDLEKHIKNEVLKTNQQINTYIDDTLNENGIKNFYNNATMIKNIAAYCTKNRIQISNEFKEKMSILNINH